MTSCGDLCITLVDKGFLALILVLAAGVVKYLLQGDQARRDLLHEITPQRAAAYAEFWKKTEPFRSTEPPDLTAALADAALEDLDRAYFDEGRAMYLSFDAARRLLAAKDLLRAERRRVTETDGKAVIGDAAASRIREAFSGFRTQLKQDLLIYSAQEARRPLKG